MGTFASLAITTTTTSTNHMLLPDPCTSMACYNYRVRGERIIWAKIGSVDIHPGGFKTVQLVVDLRFVLIDC